MVRKELGKGGRMTTSEGGKTPRKPVGGSFGPKVMGEKRRLGTEGKSGGRKGG